MIGLLVPMALAQEPAGPTIAGSAEYQFAKHLDEMDANDAAWIEYERAAAIYGPGPAADRARFYGCLALADADAALVCWRQAAALAEPGSAPLFELGLAEARYRRGEYPAATARLSGLEAPELSDARAFREAWISLRTGDTAAAGARLGEIGPASPMYEHAAAFSREIQADPDLPTRSPALAGVLSAALPGAGQVYAGEARDGASALLTSGILIGGTAALVARENWPGAALVGGLAVGFYAGNIFSAVNSAKRRNLRLERAWINGLERSYEMDFTIAPGEPGDPLTPEISVGAP